MGQIVKKGVFDFSLKKTFALPALLCIVMSTSMATSPQKPFKDLSAHPYPKSQAKGIAKCTSPFLEFQEKQKLAPPSDVFNHYNNYFLISTLDFIFYRHLKISYLRILHGKASTGIISVPITIALKAPENSTTNTYFPKQKVAGIGVELYLFNKTQKRSGYYIGFGGNWGIQAYTLSATSNTIMADYTDKIRGFYYDFSFRNGFLIQTKSKLTMSLGFGLGWCEELISYYNYNVSEENKHGSFFILPVWFNLGLPVTHSQ